MGRTLAQQSWESNFNKLRPLRDPYLSFLHSFSPKRSIQPNQQVVERFFMVWWEKQWK